MKLKYSLQIFQKHLNIKFHENPSSGSRVVPMQTAVETKLTVASRKLANAPKNVTQRNSSDEFYI